MYKELPSIISDLANTTFEENLLFFFIGGSYAKETATLKSDVDAFVVLKKSDRERELIFAKKFKKIHENYNVLIDHYGEIFDFKTFNNLISYTIEFLNISTDIQHTGCYHGDCIFSIFRKGDVILKMLEEPKLNKIGDLTLLAKYEQLAIKYFADFPMERIQLEKGNLKLPKKMRNLENKLFDKNDILDTPVGVSLYRWFNIKETNIANLRTQIFTPMPNSNIKMKTCPLIFYPESFEFKKLYKDQCLVFQSSCNQ